MWIALKPCKICRAFIIGEGYLQQNWVLRRTSVTDQKRKSFPVLPFLPERASMPMSRGLVRSHLSVPAWRMLAWRRRGWDYRNRRLVAILGYPGASALLMGQNIDPLSSYDPQLPTVTVSSEGV